MSAAVPKKRTSDEGVEESKSLPLTVRVSSVIYEKLRAEADERGVSVPALIVYQMGEWLRGDELDRRTRAGGASAAARRARHEAREELEEEHLYACPDCDKLFPLSELLEDGVYLNCPECGNRSTLQVADDAEEEESAERREKKPARKEREREEPKTPEVLTCKAGGGILPFDKPCGWAGKKTEAVVSFNPLTRERVYSCPKCAKQIHKARLFGPKDDVLTCPECKTAYRREELKEDSSWGKTWLRCPDEDCNAKVIEAAPAASGEAKGKAKKKSDLWDM